LLPNNPLLTDGLITLALQRRGITETLRPIDDGLAKQTRHNAASRKY
jgi:CobQ-like glutamine amidotransferase family enzyme